jgi:hypothetical protein
MSGQPFSDRVNVAERGFVLPRNVNVVVVVIVPVRLRQFSAFFVVGPN